MGTKALRETKSDWFSTNQKPTDGRFLKDWFFVFPDSGRFFNKDFFGFVFAPREVFLYSFCSFLHGSADYRF
jgi:hypothetical protein